MTVTVTTNDGPKPTGNTFAPYYDLLEATAGPVVAVMKDVDSRPGRGAAFGDGMAHLAEGRAVIPPPPTLATKTVQGWPKLRDLAQKFD